MTTEPENKSLIPETFLESNEEIVTLMRGKTACTCAFIPPVPMMSQLGKLTNITTVCNSMCAAFCVSKEYMGYRTSTETLIADFKCDRMNNEATVLEVRRPSHLKTFN